MTEPKIHAHALSQYYTMAIPARPDMAALEFRVTDSDEVFRFAISLADMARLTERMRLDALLLSA